MKEIKMDRDKIEKLEPFATGKYENVDLDHLVIYAIGWLEKISVELSFENAVVAIFKLFPGKFSLLGFPEYPDACRINKCLWRCTDKKKQWLGGKIRQGFIITERTRRIIKEAEDLLVDISNRKMETTSQTRRKESILKDIIFSPAYLKYIK